MSRLKAIEPKSTFGKTKELLHARDGYLALHIRPAVAGRQDQVSDENVQAVRKAGVNDAEVAEIIAHVAINIFTNYFNIATQVDIDFPKVSSAKAA